MPDFYDGLWGILLRKILAVFSEKLFKLSGLKTLSLTNTSRKDICYSFQKYLRKCQMEKIVGFCRHLSGDVELMITGYGKMAFVKYQLGHMAYTNYLEGGRMVVANQEVQLDLFDFIRVIGRRKWIIITIFMAALLSSVVFSYFILGPVYQSETSFLVNLSENILGIEPWAPSTYANIMQGPEARSRTKERLHMDQLPDIRNITIEVIGTNLIRFTARANSPGEAQLLAETWTRTALEEIAKIRIANLENRITTQRAVVEELQKQLDAQAHLLNDKRLFGDRTFAQQLIVQSNSFGLLQELIKEKAKLNTLEGKTNLFKEGKGIGIQLVSPSSLPKKPVSPKKILNVLAASMMGLVLGVFVAFAYEFYVEHLRVREVNQKA